MRAILRTRFGGPEVLVIREIPEPEPKVGHAVIQVKAFGLNHAELHMRKGEWAEIAEVSGIECVGVVKSCPGGEFAAGSKVAALMGGLGRTICNAACAVELPWKGAHLEGAKFKAARFDERTRWPTGFLPRAAVIDSSMPTSTEPHPEAQLGISSSSTACAQWVKVALETCVCRPTGWTGR
jgi:alcohol dehydrogenase-like protein